MAARPVASGSAQDLGVVEALLVRLDEDDMRSRRTTVYRLNNAGADAVAIALTDILSQELQLSVLGQYPRSVSKGIWSLKARHILYVRNHSRRGRYRRCRG